jgi:hypothetical protein
MIVATIVRRFGDGPMTKLVVLRLYPRVLSAVALVALGSFLVGLDPLLGAVPNFGPGATERTPPVSVNHFRKGNRLPLVHPGLYSGKSTPNGLQTQERPPLGCDPAFSPVSSPAPVVIYGRCMA